MVVSHENGYNLVVFSSFGKDLSKGCGGGFEASQTREVESAKPFVICAKCLGGEWEVAG